MCNKYIDIRYFNGVKLRCKIFVKGETQMSEILLQKNTRVNEGMDFSFNGSISQEVLENYLSRAITYSYMDHIADDAL